MAIDSEQMDFNYIITHQKAMKENLAKKNKKIVEYDLKIVSFKLGSEFYGIDIMYVKEILMEGTFTQVPNTLDFVLGVLNLRGEIIPIIDIGKMFNINSTIIDEPEKKDTSLSIIVINADNIMIGIVVDRIYRVIQLRNDDIQPPSPLLGQINEKYIKGVAEIEKNLFVIFDTDSIFSSKEKTKKDVITQNKYDISEDFFVYFYEQIEQFESVHISDYNKSAFRNLYNKYIFDNKIKEMPSINKEISDKILNSFLSQHTGKLWEEKYVNIFKDDVINELNKICSDEIRILNLGCGGGHETFSLLFIILNYFTEIDIEIIAADSNLSKVSNASGFEISKDEIPSWINIEKYFIEISKNNYKINKEINDLIYFEFHDIKNIIKYKQEFDLVIARDLSLYLGEDNYKILLDNIAAKLISGGILVIGDNEIIQKHKSFNRINTKHIPCYIKK